MRDFAIALPVRDAVGEAAFRQWIEVVGDHLRSRYTDALEELGVEAVKFMIQSGPEHRFGIMMFTGGDPAKVMEYFLDPSRSGLTRMTSSMWADAYGARIPETALSLEEVLDLEITGGPRH